MIPTPVQLRHKGPPGIDRISARAPVAAMASPTVRRMAGPFASAFSWDNPRLTAVTVATVPAANPSMVSAPPAALPVSIAAKSAP